MPPPPHHVTNSAGRWSPGSRAGRRERRDRLGPERRPGHVNSGPSRRTRTTQDISYACFRSSPTSRAPVQKFRRNSLRDSSFTKTTENPMQTHHHLQLPKTCSTWQSVALLALASRSIAGSRELSGRWDSLSSTTSCLRQAVGSSTRQHAERSSTYRREHRVDARASQGRWHRPDQTRSRPTSRPTSTVSVRRTGESTSSGRTPRAQRFRKLTAWNSPLVRGTSPGRRLASSSATGKDSDAA